MAASPKRDDVFTVIDDLADRADKLERSLRGVQIESGAVNTNYPHNQGVAASTWVVAHNLGYNPAGILVFDSAGTQWVDFAVTYVDINNMTLSFLVGGAPAAFAGKAFIS